LCTSLQIVDVRFASRGRKPFWAVWPSFLKVGTSQVRGFSGAELRFCERKIAAWPGRTTRHFL
jgi:hypothetical protein